jgi:gliding motility-associated-like protein
VVATTVTLLASDTTLLVGQSCNPAEVGVFSQTLTNQAGCDSTVVTTVAFFHTDTVQVAANSCDPGATGVFFQTLLNGQGCDSVVATTVTLLASDTTLLFDADCNPASVGVFTQTLTNQAGCDSTVITTITFSLTDTVAVAATSCDPAATGVFVQNLVTPQGCDSTVITTVTLLPSSTTLLSGESCNPAEVGVFTQSLTNQHGCDSTVVTTVTFFHTDTLQLAATSCDPAAVGVFLQNFVSFQGCDSVVSTTVTLLPSHAVELQSTTCDPAAAGVFTQNLTNQFGCDSTVVETVTLLPSSLTTLVFQTCDPTQTGTIVTVLTNQWGCDSTVTALTTLLPANSCNVQATLAGSNIPCGATTGTLSLLPTVGTAPFGYTVFLGGQAVASGTASALGQTQTIGGLAPGNYTVTVSSPNGFSATASATIVQLFPPTATAIALSDFNGFPVSCAGAADGEARATVTGGAPPYTFTWSSGDQIQQAGDLAAGTYSVTVTDANGCTAVAAVALGEPEPLQFSFAVNDLDCFGYQDGTIQVEPAGGVPPYRYALGSAASQNSATFNGLSAGTYTVVVSDANDCQQTEIILVDAAVTTDVALGEDQTVALGDSAILQAIVNIPADSILSVAWTPPFDGSECPECLDQIVTPFVSTTYVVRVTALNGCTDEDRTTVFVDRSRQVYAPNVFTPNGDGQHDLFTLYAREGTVLRFRSFQIYDRWGEAVFFRDEFLPGDPDVGWDGRLKGKEMGPGVFVWMVEVEFIDGKTVLYKGDVTVMR